MIFAHHSGKDEEVKYVTNKSGKWEALYAVSEYLFGPTNREENCNIILRPLVQ